MSAQGIALGVINPQPPMRPAGAKGQCPGGNNSAALTGRMENTNTIPRAMPWADISLPLRDAYTKPETFNLLHKNFTFEFLRVSFLKMGLDSPANILF